MATDLIRYDLLVQDALRSVVKKVLVDALREGLPGEHHFYITFRTHAPGVRLSAHMRKQYPEEMTIILQHQFWDLSVTDQAFEVGLSFGGKAEKLLIPFDTVTGFFDPSVQFGLKFELQNDEEEMETGANDSGPIALVPPAAKPAKAPSAEPEKLKTKGSASEPSEAAPAPTKKPAAEKVTAEKPVEVEADAEKPTANVVSIDAFRKKT